MIKSFTLSAIVILSFLFNALQANDPGKLKSISINKKNTIILPWIKNAGQYDNKVAFATKTKVADIAILKNGNINYFLNTDSGKNFFFTEFILNNKLKNCQLTGKNISQTKFNFLKKDTKFNLSNISSFNTVDFGEIADGINMCINIKADNIEKVITVKPFSNPDRIRLKLEEIDDMCTNDEGELQLEINGEIISFTTPVAWQLIDGRRVDIPVSFDIKEKFIYGFELGNYDPRYTLFIDPLLSSSFIGGSQLDLAKKVLVGKTGNVYLGGITNSFNMPVTGGAYDETFNNSPDIFIAMFNSDLSDLEICTYIGGSEADILNDMKLDTFDNVYFAGRTVSPDYPVSANAFDTIFNGSVAAGIGDMVISCLNSKLNELKYSTFVGGDLDDVAVSFDFDADDNLVITGTSNSGILSIGPQIYIDTKDLVFFKMNKILSKILASNSIQTDSLSVPVDLAVLDSQAVFITGFTTDSAFPVTTGAFSDTFLGLSDIFVIRLSYDLSDLEVSTFVGGRKSEVPASIILDDSDNVYISGATNSPDFPTTINAYDTIIANEISGKEDAFLCILNYDLNTMKASTFVGGNDIDIAGEITLDTFDNIYISGYTYSSDFPVFCDSYDDTYNGSGDGFLAKFSANLENLLSSTYFGGTDNDFCYSIAQDSSGNIYSAGTTNSIDFPVFSGYDTYYNGDGGDGFILKMTPGFDKPYPCCANILEPEPFSSGLPLDFKVVWEEARGATGYYFSAGTSKDTFDLVYHLDIRDTTFYILHGLSCGDTIFIKINPYNNNGINKYCETVWFTTHKPFLDSENIDICEGDSIMWQNNVYKTTGLYFENFTDVFGCDSTYVLYLEVNPNYYEYEEKDICEGDSYYWQGEYYSYEGVFTKNYNTVNGCDSIFELKLNINLPYLFSESISICKGDSIEWQNYILTSGGTYYAGYETIDGCDSTYILELTLLPSYEYHDTAAICEGDSFDWQGQSYSFAGDYQKRYETTDGCDSIYYLHLTLNANFHFDENTSLCNGDTLEWQGMLLDSAGTYFAEYKSIDGCDSIYQLDLNILPSYFFEEDAMMCSEDTFLWHGLNIDSSGTYYAYYTTIAGCDSIFKLNLGLLPSYYYEEEAGLCPGDTLEWQGMLLDSAGTYFAEYKTIDNCDSIYQLELNTSPEYYFEEKATLCENDTLEWQGLSIDSSGTYYAKYTTINGCDSIYQIYVEKIIIDNAITQNGDTLFAVFDSLATYQWVTCPGYDTIQGANGSLYITTESGSFAVIINKLSCTDTSGCVNVVNSGIEKLDEPEIKIYPNPVNRQYLFVSIDDFEEVKTLELCDFSGKILLKFNKINKINKINVERLVSGLYFVRVYKKNNIINKKVVIIKE